MTGYQIGRDAAEGYVWLSDPSLNLGSSGPSRVSTDDADPTYKPRPVGFTADLSEPEPTTWEGDNA